MHLGAFPSVIVIFVFYVNLKGSAVRFKFSFLVNIDRSRPEYVPLQVLHFLEAPLLTFYTKFSIYYAVQENTCLEDYILPELFRNGIFWTLFIKHQKYLGILLLNRKYILESCK